MRPQGLRENVLRIQNKSNFSQLDKVKLEGRVKKKQNVSALCFGFSVFLYEHLKEENLQVQYTLTIKPLDAYSTTGMKHFWRTEAESLLFKSEKDIYSMI